MAQARHPGTIGLLDWLRPNPNLPPEQFVVANAFEALALNLIPNIEDGPELTAGLRKLLEAKDCFVRASMVRPPGAPDAE